MPAYYTFLISSLPLLNFNAKPPLNLENFFARCKNLIPDQELEILIRSCQQDVYALGPQARVSLRRWGDFETTLRNELVRARAARKKIDPLKFLRLPDEPQTQISHLAAAAYRSSSILEAEQILDQARWNFLEDLSFGHYFDFDYLLIYGLKLKILERWDKIKKSDKEYLFNSVVAN
ncbi:MAG TPA: DUF2764 family protein [Candidatus Omnitrophota bacterium]|nr:DUF2764 family protein [Candidatus Omnitrophota bacterium]HPT39747.1 DUF2764 family protein [Candidatus Omnitrophota bacterium]